MTTYNIGSATVRIHGNCEQSNLREASERFMKKVERKRKNEKKNTEKTA